jgi:hypothetical protein
MICANMSEGVGKEQAQTLRLDMLVLVQGLSVRPDKVMLQVAEAL